MNLGPLRSWILAQLPESMRPSLRSGYRLALDVQRAARARRGLLRATRVVWLRPEVADVENFRLLKPGPGEILLRTHTSLVSPGTERAFLLGLPNTNAAFPTIPGYSAAGIVEATGKGVTGLQPGQRVAAVAPHASRSRLQAGLAVPIPEGVSDEQACFVELGVIALQGVRRARIRPGDRVLVLGQGLVGQLAIQLARWCGAVPLVAASRSEALATISKASGADEVLALARDDVAPEELLADVVLEATGSASAIRTACACARPGGRVALLGSSRGMTTGFDFDRDVVQRQLTVVGAHISSVAQHESSPGRWTRRDEAVLFLDLIRNGSVDLGCLVSERAAPADANRVYGELITGRTPTMGIVFDWHNLRRSENSMSIPTAQATKTGGHAPGRKLRLALVGCGEISAHNATGIRASKACTLTQVMDVQEATARALGAQFKVPHTTSLDSVLGNPDVDAIVIAVPHHLHAQITTQAAAARKHVIVEKPIATTLADADAMIDACKRAGVALSVLFSFRYQPQVLRARQLVQAGALGDVAGTSIQFVTEKPASYWGQGYTGRVLTDWRGSWEKCGGGVLIMNVCHTIDYFRFITGLEVSQVYSEFSTLNSPVEVEDIIAVSLRYANGAIGNIHATTLARGEQMAAERIWGTHGSMVLAPAPPQVYTLRRVAGLAPARWQGFGKLAAVNRVAEYMDRFAAAVFAGNEPEITGTEGRENLAVVLAAYQAGRSGQAVSPAALGSPSPVAQAIS